MTEQSSFAPVTIYTVGHSDRSASDFVDLLKSNGITALVDVRAHPISRLHPHFTDNILRETLTDAGIVYHWAGRGLGGRRRARHDSPHHALKDAASRAYADHMDTDSFQRAAQQLLNLAHNGPTAIMCAERSPQDCHRALIADYLTLQGHTVVHLVDTDLTKAHTLSPHARRESRQLIYDRLTTGRLDLTE